MTAVLAAIEAPRTDLRRTLRDAGPTRIDARRLAAWRAFLEAHARVTELLERELRGRQDLPLTWYDVLVQLSEAPDNRLRMQDLAGRVLLSKSGLTRLVDRMQAAGLVERVECPHDRRGTFAALTPDGYATLRRSTRSHLAGVAEHFTDHLDADDAEALRRILGRIAAAAADA